MGKRFDVIDAEPQDMDWIRDLAAQASIHTLGSPRMAPSQCAEFIVEEFPELVQFALQGSYRFLVAIDREKSDARIGYLLLNLFDLDQLGRRQTCVEDFAVVPEYAGHHIGVLLFEAGATLTGDLGVNFMAGDCGADNRLINTAERYNCVLESHSFFRACTPEAEKIMEEAQKERDHRAALAARVRRIHARRSQRKRRSEGS
jgi:GNAT superfamily N-acetyltransferase